MAKLIPFLGAAHEGRKLGVEARGGLEERRVADALVDRKLGAGDHLRRVFGGDQVKFSGGYTPRSWLLGAR